MAISPTFPGLYIEELPSQARTITASATSILVAVGYTHPYKTKNFETPVELFGFTDYEREFGGHYASGIVDNNVAYAVSQFFLNGGTHCYVVGLEAHAHSSAGADLGKIPRATATVGSVVFSSQEPTDLIQMIVTVDNLQSNDHIADITISYGNQSETFRAVTLDTADPDNFIEARIKKSSLVTVAPGVGGYGSFTQKRVAFELPTGFATSIATSFSSADFTHVFDPDGSLDKLPIFNLLIIPGVADNAIWSAALAFCEQKHVFMILDPPRQAAADDSTAVDNDTLTKIADLIGAFPASTNGALYFPYIKSNDPLTGQTIELPPSGSVAGIFARIDANQGVWKAPAGLETTVKNTPGLVDRGRMTDQRQGTLNDLGVNCLREFPGIGVVVFGARTQVAKNPSFRQWRYVSARRTALFVEQTLLANLGWVPFQPNGERLWVAIRTTIENFMLGLFTQGAFQGSTPSKAFRVVCDSTTTTQRDIDNGIVNIIVAFALLGTVEFAIIKIAQLAGQTP
jgi:phage tail sheath protein FI